MASLGEQLYRHVAGRPYDDEDDPRAMARRALEHAGSQNKLASALGLARSTVQNWFKHNGTPGDAAAELLRVALRRAELGSGREAQLRRSDHLVVEGDQDGRQRTITLDRQYLTPGTVSRMVDAYLRGARPSELQHVVWAGIHSAPFYKSLFYPGGPGAATRLRQEAAGKRPARRPEPASGGPGAPRKGFVYGGGDAAELAYEGQDLDDEYAIAVSGVHS